MKRCRSSSPEAFVAQKRCKREADQKARLQSVLSAVAEFCQGKCIEPIGCQPCELNPFPTCDSAWSPAYAPTSPAYSPTCDSSTISQAVLPQCFICLETPDPYWEWLLERKAVVRQSVMRQSALQPDRQLESNEGLVVKIDVHGREPSSFPRREHPKEAYYKFPDLCKMCAFQVVPSPLSLCYSMPPELEALFREYPQIIAELAGFLPLRLYDCSWPAPSSPTGDDYDEDT